MGRKKKLTNRVAKIENFFVENAQYILNAREQKIILHLAANLNFEKDNFHEQIVPVKELEQMIKTSDAKWGGIYKEMSEFTERIAGKKIKFPTNVLLNGEALPGYVTWFQSITPCYNQAEEVCLKFRFNQDLKPFLLNLNQYVRINLSEIAGLDSFYSLRMYQIFKANLAKRQKYVNVSSITYELGDLRELLGAKGKYIEFKYFNRDILARATEEINNKTQIYVKYEPLRTKRKVTHIKFTFCDKKDYKEYTQLSFLDSMPTLDENKNKRTATERKARQKDFNYENFKKAYPLIYKKKLQENRKALAEIKSLQNRDDHLEATTRNACMVWFSEYA